MESTDHETINQTNEAIKAWVATDGLDFGIRLVTALLIFVIGKCLAKIISGAINHAFARSKMDVTLNQFLTKIAYTILLIVVVLAALDRVGVKTTSMVAIIGAAGLAIGLAMQGSLANFAAGVMIILFRPFKSGDFINAGGIMGIVEEISIFTTNLRTPDNLAVIVPNAQITGGSITNFSAKDTRRVDMTFGISYDDNISAAKEAIWAVLKADARVLKDPESIVGVMELADSSVNIVVRPWVNRDDYWAVRMDMMEKVKAALESNGCSIPFPQRDVHIHQTENKNT